MKKLIFGLLISLSLFGCRKFEGEGGRASISGKILVHERLYINGICTDTVTYVGSKEDVYIIYGDDDMMYDDKIDASLDGSFKFSYLQPGTYTIYAYSNIFNTGNNVPNNDDDYNTLEPVSVTVTIGKKEQADIGTITLIRN